VFNFLKRSSVLEQKAKIKLYHVLLSLVPDNERVFPNLFQWMWDHRWLWWKAHSELIFEFDPLKTSESFNWPKPNAFLKILSLSNKFNSFALFPLEGWHPFNLFPSSGNTPHICSNSPLPFKKYPSIIYPSVLNSCSPKSLTFPHTKPVISLFVFQKNREAFGIIRN